MSDLLAWATDAELRRNGSSGGFVRAMLTYLFRTDRIDAALVARTGEEDQPFSPSFVVLTSPDQLRSRRYCSVYYPLAPVATMMPLDLRYAATMLPCHTEDLWRLQADGFLSCIHYVFELLCGGTPRPEWSAAQFGTVNVAYRGNGWPGEMEVNGIARPRRQWADEDLQPSCRSCRRAGSGQADWLCGDPWGLPPKSVGDGKTLVRVCTDKAQQVTDNAVTDGAVFVEPDNGLMQRRLKKHARRHG